MLMGLPVHYGQWAVWGWESGLNYPCRLLTVWSHVQDLNASHRVGYIGYQIGRKGYTQPACGKSTLRTKRVGEGS